MKSKLASRTRILCSTLLLALFAAMGAVAATSCSGRRPATASSVPTTAELVSNYVNWQPPKNSADFPNPYRGQVLAAGAGIVPALIAAHTPKAKLSSAIARALGEIGDPAAFPFLLEAFRSDSRQDIALAIGSSCRASEVDETFRLLDKPALRKLLSVILGEKWASLKDEDSEEVRKHVLEHLEEIIRDCRQRSKPVLG
ncbi:MAG: HEAT repeat domain-containing protein [Planctomycetaceae bacterium]|nr:HEAT repeat domain-containing protein [Planctomycetaceae bacterium]